MQKNVAGQKIGAQLVSASDGSAFTGSVTVAVTGDAGTQATGSVGSGACTHEGNGYHTYAPAQAETNYTLIAFTFTGTGAIPATVQVFTTGFDPTAAQIPANVTQFGGSNLTAASGIPEVKVASIAANAITATAIASDAITDAKVASDVTIASVTGSVGSVTGAVGSVTGAVGSVTGAVGSVTGNVGGNVVGTVASVVGAVGSVTGNVGGNVTGSVGSVASGGITAASIADAAIDRATFAVDTGLITIRSNTAQAGAGGSITLDASASAVDDFYKNALVLLTGGTGSGQSRTIGGYTGSTKVATVTPNWATSPDNTSTFAILPAGAVSGASAPTAADVADAVWDEARSGHTTSGSFGEGVKAESLNTQAKADVNSEADTALSDYGALKPTTAGRTLDVSTTGEAGIDWANVGSPTTTVGLSGTTVKTATDVETDTQDLQSRIPAALGANGNIKADVRDFGGTAATSASGRPEVNATHFGGSAVVHTTGKLWTLDGSGNPIAPASATTQISNKTDNLPSDPADESALEAAITAAVSTLTAAVAALNNISTTDVRTEVDAALDSTVPDSIPADGTRPSMRQAAYMGTQFLLERSVSGTTLTIYKPDGTTALFTATLDDATSPSAITRAT